MVLKAAAFAAEKHRLHRRKSGDLPYINHPLSVANLIWNVGGVHDPVAASAAVLHDTIEDTDTNPEELGREFGGEIMAIVQELTLDKAMTKPEQRQDELARITTFSHRAKLVRLADKIHNVHSLIEHPPARWDMARQLEYVDWCERLVGALAGTNEALERRFADEVLRAREAILRRNA
jgi:guanosine-3',5'-bis(diphosphate) 3'-pyrophosphohydrolase